MTANQQNLLNLYAKIADAADRRAKAEPTAYNIERAHAKQALYVELATRLNA